MQGIFFSNLDLVIILYKILFKMHIKEIIFVVLFLHLLFLCEPVTVFN